MAEGKTDILIAPQISAGDERAALEAERKEIEALEKKVQTDEERFALRKRREDVEERSKRMQKLSDAEEEKRLQEIDERKRRLEEEKETAKKGKVDQDLRRQAEEEEKAFVTDLCAVLPDDERNQLSWALFKIEPGKGESQVTNIALSPDLNIYDAVREHCPEGGSFHLKLMKGGVFATRKTLGSLVKSEQAKQLILEIPLSFKIQLYSKDEDEYPKAGFGRFRPDFGNNRRFGGYTSPPPDYAGLPGYRGSRLPVTPEQIELQKERERDERLERKEERDDAKEARKREIERLEKERDNRLAEVRESHNQQMQMFTAMLKEAKGGGADIQAMIGMLEKNYASQVSIIKESSEKQMLSLKEEMGRLREKAEKAEKVPIPAEAPKNGESLALFQVMKESSTIQATVLKESNESARRAAEAQANASKEAAIAQAQAMKEATTAQAEALKAALSGQSEMQKQIITMQTETMKDMVGRMMGDFKGTIENMMKQQERDRDAMLRERAAERAAADAERQRDREALKLERDAAEKERQRERDAVKAERERDRDMNKTMVDLWKSQAEKKQGGDAMMDTVMKMSNNLLQNSMRSIESNISIAGKVGKMLKKFDRDDEEEEEEPKEKKSEFDKILDVVQPPLMKVLDIALEQAKQGKDPAQIHADAEKLLQEQVRQQAAEKASGEKERRRNDRREREPEPEAGDQFDEALKEFRDDIIPVVASAIEKNADEDWLVGLMMSEDFPAAARTMVALMPLKKIHEKLVKFSNAEEKAVLSAQGAVEYLDKVQKRMMEVQKKLKEAEREMDKGDGQAASSAN